MSKELIIKTHNHKVNYFLVPNNTDSGLSLWVDPVGNYFVMKNGKDVTKEYSVTIGQTGVPIVEPLKKLLLANK